MYDFTEVVPISVKERDGTDPAVKAHPGPGAGGPALFPERYPTDQPKR